MFHFGSTLSVKDEERIEKGVIPFKNRFKFLRLI